MGRIYENLGLDTRARHSRRSGFVFGGLEVGGGGGGFAVLVKGGVGLCDGFGVRGDFGMGVVWVWVRGVLGGFWGGGGGKLGVGMGVEGRGNLRG